MSDPATQLLIAKIMQGDEAAWQRLIDQYEGRLTAFVRARIRNPHSVEDIVQEVFLGFHRSLPHFDPARELENYLFTIAAHKIRDHLRSQGRHPLALVEDVQTSENAGPPQDSIRGPSSLMASAERMQGEESRLVRAITSLLGEWQGAGDYRRIQCIELLFVAGWPNKKVAEYLNMSDQQVANYKFQVIERLNKTVGDSS